MDDKKTTEKQSYEAPKLRVIELMAEEVMGVGCKMASGGLINIMGAVCGIPACVSNGS